MISASKNKQKIISFDPSDVSVVSVSPNGSVNIRVKYEVDLVKSVRFNVNSVNISIGSANKITSPGVLSSRSSKSPDEVLNSLIRKSSNRKADLASKKANIKKTFRSDVTKKIDNSSVRKLSRSTDLEPKRTISSNVSLGRQSKPVLQTPISSVVKDFKISGNPSRDANNLILQYGISPANLGIYSPTFASTEDTIAGTLPKGVREELAKEAESIKRVFLGDILDISSSEEVEEGESTPEVSTRSSSRASVVETVRITLSDIEDSTSLFVQVTAEDSSQSSIDSSGCVIDFAEKLSEATRPKTNLAIGGAESTSNVVVPNEDAIRSPDTNIWKDRQDIFGALNSFDVTEVTDIGSTIDSFGVDTFGVTDVYEVWTKIGSGPFYPAAESSWAQLDEIAIGTSPDLLQNFYNFSTAYGYAASAIFRFVGVGSRANDFVEIVRPGVNHNMASTSFLLGSNFVSETDKRVGAVTAMSKIDGVEVSVSNIEVDGIIQIVRKDHTLNESDFSPVEGESFRIPSQEKDVVVFVDSSAKLNHAYEYKAKVFTRKGRELLLAGSAFIIHREVRTNLIDIKVTTPDVSINRDGQIDISFNISKNLSNSNSSFIKDLLEKAGLASLYNSELKADKDKISKLIALKIERVDLLTGDIEDFGIFSGDRFSDLENQQSSGVSPLKRGRRYRYIVSALSREADTVFERAQRTKIDRTTGKSYSFSPSKFLKPSIKKSGAIPSSNFTAGTNVTLDFEEGYTGTQVFVDVATRERKASIVSVTAKRNSNGANVVRWRVRGNLRRIDHFVVVGKKLGMRVILGRTHNISESKVFEFVDGKLSREVGAVSYLVFPVYNNYEIGTSAESKKITSLNEVLVKK